MYRSVKVSVSGLVAVVATVLATVLATVAPGWALPSVGPGDYYPDYFSTPNWAFSPPLRKFIDPLPVLPIAVPDTVSYPGSDYYVIELRQYEQLMHTDLNPTTLRGYVQANQGTNLTPDTTPEQNLCGAAPGHACTILDNTVAPPPIQYLGPVIVAKKDRPVRITFRNLLGAEGGTPSGELFVPVDQTVMGAGNFEVDFDPVSKAVLETHEYGRFRQNRAVLHLHGGRTPWISDGTPHQWITPAAETNAGVYTKGVSVANVPDMPAPLAGEQTYYWTNQQSARLMFYHDHAWGITRLNVYVGEAAGYLITDDMEQALIAPGGPLAAPPLGDFSGYGGYGVPLVIQDKTFVDANTIAATDPMWDWGTGAMTDGVITKVQVATPGSGYVSPTVTITDGPGGPDLGAVVDAVLDPAVPATGRIVGFIVRNRGAGYTSPFVTITDPSGTGATATANTATRKAEKTGDLWWPHVYMPAQNPYNPDFTGINPMGRWHYGPWFWPPTPVCGVGGAAPPWCIDIGEVPNPYFDCYAAGDEEISNPGSFYAADGPCLNPEQPPYMPGTPDVSWGAEAFLDTMTVNGTAFPTATFEPKKYRLRILNASHDRFLNLQLYQAVSKNGGSIAEDPAPRVFTGPATDLTEVSMVPAVFNPAYPARWPTDSREGGVPDPATAGPAFIQIGTEGGLLPAPVLLENQPVQWNADPTMFNVGNVLQQADGGGTLILGPAERADVIVDFSDFAGKTLILYNDAPTAFPALDPHYDYYTGAPDRQDIGGAPAIPAGVGPNNRTVMQIRVSGSGGGGTPNYSDPVMLSTLQGVFQSTPGVPGAFAASQDPIIVGQQEYGTAGNGAYDTTFPTTWPNWGVSRISDTVLKFKDVGGTLHAVPMKPKAIHDEMGGSFDNYGRMSAKLGLEVPLATAAISTFALQNFVDPPTEILEPGVDPDDIQIWKITHNGVDTHPIHFHLFDVQVINRVGWDGFIRKPDPNELGWKDTVRMAPLEDTIVALRPIAPRLPFGVPKSVRPLNPATFLGSEMGFSNIDPLTGGRAAANTVNGWYDFGWEYVWHCHILSHEENDMMRSIVYNFVTTAPEAPSALTATWGLSQIQLSWTDTTPPASSLGNPANEIGFRIERSTDGSPFAELGFALANATSYLDTPVSAGVNYSYRVFAYNPSGDSPASNVASMPPLTITTNAFVNANLGVYYSRSVAVTGGLAPYTWALAGGALPTGLSINPSTGIIGGTPSAVGTFDFTIQVTDSPGNTTSKAFSLTVVNAALSIFTTSFANAQNGVYYSRSVAVSGGTTPYAWAVSAGALPTGLGINAATGIISGIPSATGTFTFTIEVTDSALPTPAVVSRAYSITVIPPALAITTNSFSNASRGVYYSRSVAVFGGTAPYTWALSAGALPTGLSLNPATGIISGTPTVAGTANFTIQVTDSALPTPAVVTKAFSLTVVNGPLTIVTNTFSNGTVGVYYGRSVATTGGTTPYTWAITGGALPPGIILLTGSGILTGTPTLAGTYTFTVQVTDSALPTPAVVSKGFSITIN